MALHPHHPPSGRGFQLFSSPVQCPSQCFLCNAQLTISTACKNSRCQRIQSVWLVSKSQMALSLRCCGCSSTASKHIWMLQYCVDDSMQGRHRLCKESHISKAKQLTILQCLETPSAATKSTSSTKRTQRGNQSAQMNLTVCT